MRKFLLLVLLFSIGVTTAQKETYKSEVINVTNLVEGSLLIPDTVKPPLVILIPGSGPTDRDGNQAMQKNNSLRFLAEGLYE
ncbi:MAG: alpha/beta hydrolase, partial [Flavobacteriaceae bacterium]|nr:alpha/beta hydrolase [Flavobacteriaceae bacterium]